MQELDLDREQATKQATATAAITINIGTTKVEVPVVDGKPALRQNKIELFRALASKPSDAISAARQIAAQWPQAIEETKEAVRIVRDQTGEPLPWVASLPGLVAACLFGMGGEVKT